MRPKTIPLQIVQPRLPKGWTPMLHALNNQAYPDISNFVKLLLNHYNIFILYQ